MTGAESVDAIGILGGTGAEGRGIAVRLALAGHQVRLGSRDVARAAQAAAAVRALTGRAAIEGVDNHDAATAGVVVLAVPFGSAAAALAAYGPRFPSGALLLDVTVPLVFEGGAPRLVDVPEGSAAEHVRRHAPVRVSVAAAFKILPAALLGDPHAPLDCDDLVAADSDDARRRALALVSSIAGLRALDAGPLTACRTIERMTILAIQLNQRYRVRDARYRVVGV